MEEALDLRIHNRRSSFDSGPSSYPTFYASRVQLLVTYQAKVEESHGGGDLVIVEADTASNSNDQGSYPARVMSPSPSPGGRSSDTDTDKGSSPYYQPHQSSSSTGQGRSLSMSSLVDQDMIDEAQKSSRSSTKYTSKHVPNVDRMLKPTRLMCFLCDQKAKNGKTLETHIQKSHYVQTAQGRFLCCTECGYKYDSVEQLKSHFESSHSPRRAGETKVKAYYPCSHCSRMYRKQSLLDAHMRLVNQKDTWKKNNVNANT